MINRIFTALILILILFLYLSFEIYNSKYSSYKILKVIEADKFYLDFNHDDVPDVDELVKISDIVAFSSNLSGYSKGIANSLGLDVYDYAKAGYLARSWAIDNLEGKYIKVKDISYTYTKFNKYTFIKADFEGVDLGQILLQNGFAIAYKNNSNYDYFQLQNLNTVKQNISSISPLKFVILNKNNNIVHKLFCEYALKMNYGELILEKDLHKLNVGKCRHCYGVVGEILSLKDILKSKKTYKKSIHKKFGEIELFLINPLEFQKPSNSCNTSICKAIVREINSSKKSIDIALYGFSSQNDILNALINARNRGVKIRLVMDYSKNTDMIYKDSGLIASKFNATTDKTEILMHNKFFIFDDNKVLTGSMNISSSGSGGYNANVMVMIDSPEVAKIYKTEFNQMHEGKFQQNKKIVNSDSIKLRHAVITPYFSPKSDIYKNAILPLIREAKNEIFISIFYLTDSRLIDELILAKNRGVRILVIWDALGAINFKNLFIELRKHNIPTKAENWGGKNHEKTVLADNKLLVGSSNFSISGFNKNDENAIVIESSEIAEFYRDYFLYLFNSIDNKYLNYIPRAESFESGNSCYDGIDNNFDGFKDSDDEGCKLVK